MENEYKKELIQKIGEILITYGVRSVNMDDIAKHLSVSKKTLYKYFKDKNDVVKSVTIAQTEGESHIVCSFCETSENAIDEMIKISEFANEKLKNMNPSIIFDLQKYYPESFEIFSNHKNQFIRQCVYNNLVRGIEEGLYRSNINPHIIAELYIAKMDVIWNREIVPGQELTFSQVHLEMIRYHIRGVASEKGVEYLQKIISKLSLNI